MISLAWARFLGVEKPSTPHLYVDHRGTAHVIVPGPVAYPCAGPDCDEDTGSEDLAWCSDNCLTGWHLQQLNTPTTAGAPS